MIDAKPNNKKLYLSYLCSIIARLILNRFANEIHSTITAIELLIEVVNMFKRKQKYFV